MITVCLHWEQEIERGCTAERRDVEREGDRDAQMKRDSAAVRETPIAKEYEADRESVECILTFISALLEEDSATFSVCKIFIFGPILNLLLIYCLIIRFLLLSLSSLCLSSQVWPSEGLLVPAPWGRKDKMFGKEQREKVPSHGARGKRIHFN